VTVPGHRRTWAAAACRTARRPGSSPCWWTA